MIYADYNGSAPLAEEVKEYITNRIISGPFANPNAIHYLGQKVKMAMENARSVCAKNLGATPRQIIFNSGSTEGINTVFHSIMHGQKSEGKGLMVISGIEHSAVIKTAKSYQCEGYDLEIIETLPNGVVDVEDLKKIISRNHKRVAVVAVMAANNETGVIQPFQEISQICKQSDIPYFCDTTQYIGKYPFNFEESGLDFAVVAGHKVGALTGTGILIAKRPTNLKTLIIGGGQENGLRGGTQNYLGNETLAVALDAITKNFHRLEAIKSKRIEFENKLKQAFPNIVIMGESAPRLASTTYVSYPGVHGQAVQIELEAQNIFVTTSSACSDNEPVTSRVLRSMNVSDEVGRGVVRISLGTCCSLDVYDEIFEALVKAYKKLGKIDSF
ncbi:MAG: aminotransferase class V-fold PLP-dependent enzyme [Halobacteriovoraceae bacterium]|nr:aminotransferase class V-fold PLP-dependent enzyme [Halobacteriovoraceae bacterium]